MTTQFISLWIFYFLIRLRHPKKIIVSFLNWMWWLEMLMLRHFGVEKKLNECEMMCIMRWSGCSSSNNSSNIALLCHQKYRCGFVKRNVRKERQREREKKQIKWHRWSKLETFHFNPEWHGERHTLFRVIIQRAYTDIFAPISFIPLNFHIIPKSWTTFFL